MDPVTLAAAAVSFVTPYLLDFGKNAAKEALCNVEALYSRPRPSRLGGTPNVRRVLTQPGRIHDERPRLERL